MAHSIRATCDEHTHHHAGCRPCQARSAERGRIRHRLITYGQWRGRVDSAAARAHALTLHKRHGMSSRTIAHHAGIGRTAVDRLLSDTPPPQILARTEDAILNTRPAPPTGFVPSLGAARRLQALAALGHPIADVAKRMRRRAPEVRMVRRQATPTITAATHAAVVAVYNQLEGSDGGCDKTRAYARAHRYMPPLAWDDDTIDDPAAEPDGAIRSAADRALAGELPAEALTPDERLAVVLMLVGWRWTDQRIAEHLRWKGGRTAVGSHRRRHGIPAGTSLSAAEGMREWRRPRSRRSGLRGADLAAAIDRIDGPGVPAWQVAVLVGCTDRAVVKHRSLRQQTSGAA